MLWKNQEEKVGEENKKLSTDEIFTRIYKNEPVSREEIDFIDSKQMLDELKEKIDNAGYTITTLAIECYITPSHLHDFLNGKKQMSRDKLLAVFITLGYDTKKIQKLLKRFGYSELYSRNLRDFVILKGVKGRLGLDGINEKLEGESLDILCQKKQ